MSIDEYWGNRKRELIKALNKSIERANVDVDTLKVMREMVEKAKLKVRFEGGDYQ